MQVLIAQRQKHLDLVSGGGEIDTGREKKRAWLFGGHPVGLGKTKGHRRGQKGGNFVSLRFAKLNNLGLI
jgi:hypothetical protein